MTTTADTKTLTTVPGEGRVTPVEYEAIMKPAANLAA
ncbi:hypothetical protein ACUXNS_002649 [Brevibacterium pityocampae]